MMTMSVLHKKLPLGHAVVFYFVVKGVFVLFCFHPESLFLWEGLLFASPNFWLLYRVTGKALERISRLGTCPPVPPPLLANHQTGTRG